MISFCGKTIQQKDVLEVYGLASTSQILDLEKAVISGDYDLILKLTDEFSQNGLDFYRALLDLSENLRSSLVNSLSSSGPTVAPEQIARVLDELKQGESLVRSGLSEKANFEVTLFRAVEAGRTRSIDQVIRKITSVIPQESKKKIEFKTDPQITEQKLTKDLAPASRTEEEIPAPLGSQSDVLPGTDSHTSVPSTPINPSEKNSTETNCIETGVVTEPEMDDANLRLQVTDPEKIRARMDTLPPSVRQIVDEKFRGEYFAIEKIDKGKLI
jgi:DNA polymerase III gamma/tau subunit